MKTFRFLDFQVYRESKSFYQKILGLSNIFANRSLADQIQRSSLSVVLNIAEGSARKSDKEFARFLEISIASMNETVACLDVSQTLGRLNNEDYKVLLQQADEIIKQLGGFIKKLKVSSP